MNGPLADPTSLIRLGRSIVKCCSHAVVNVAEVGINEHETHSGASRIQKDLWLRSVGMWTPVTCHIHVGCFYCAVNAKALIFRGAPPELRFVGGY